MRAETKAQKEAELKIMDELKNLTSVQEVQDCLKKYPDSGIDIFINCWNEVVINGKYWQIIFTGERDDENDGLRSYS